MKRIAQSKLKKWEDSISRSIDKYSTIFYLITIINEYFIYSRVFRKETFNVIMLEYFLLFNLT